MLLQRQRGEDTEKPRTEKKLNEFLFEIQPTGLSKDIIDHLAL